MKIKIKIPKEFDKTIKLMAEAEGWEDVETFANAYFMDNMRSLHDALMCDGKLKLPDNELRRVQRRLEEVTA